jgi:non-ribosomal peptide synthetase component E (peptide arylation enzyme)
MSNDYLKKQPSKTESMLYELAMAQRQMENGLWSTSSLVMILAILTKQKPEEIAELMVNGDTQLKEYSDKVNEIIKKLNAEKHQKEHKDHAGHDHAKESTEESKA